MTYCPPNGRDPNPRPMQRGKDGKDAYQVWVDRQPAGADTSWCAYLEAIQGEDAYEVWVEHQPEGADTSWQAYLNAIRGESAYQIWAEYQPEGADTSIEAYLEYMAGKKGDQGEPNVLSIGTVTTVDPDQPAAAEITGDSPAQVLNLSIPQGKTGDEGPANVLTVGTVTTGAPNDPAAAEITGDSPAQVLNLTIPQGTPGKVQTVDSITAPGTSSNIVMASAVIMSLGSGDRTVTPILTNVRDVSIYCFPDNGILTVDLSAWSASALHPRINVRLCCGTNSGGKITIKPPGPFMWRLNGSYSTPEIISITNAFEIYDVVNTFGSAPAITKVYPGPDIISSLGRIGSIAFMKVNSFTAAIVPGQQVAGNLLRYAGTIEAVNTPTPSGTWVALGAISNADDRTTFARIA
jgi:hypothetical protein